MNNIIKIFIFIFILFSKSSLAQIKYDPIFSSPNTEKRHLIEEVLYTYSVSNYNKNWVIPDDFKNNKELPEYVLIDYVNNLKQGDYDRAISLWTLKSIELINKMNAVESKNKEDWLIEWRKKYSNKKFLVKEKINYGNKYILIPYYEIINNETVLIETLVFEKTVDGWFLTLNLAGNPVKRNWMNKGVRVQKLAEDLFTSQNYNN